MSNKKDIQSTRLLDEIDLTPFDNIIGFDLGHGEFSIFCISDQRQDSPKCVEINNERTQITAFATTIKNEKLIGKEAISSFQNIGDLRVGFKSKPTSDSNSNHLMKSLFSEAIKKAKNDKKIQLTNTTLILVGIPSEWSKENQIEYQILLQESLIEPVENQPKVIVIPESRAAIQCARISNNFTIDELQNSTVILLDFGSSTVDVTLLQTGQDIHDQDYGCDLGAFLLDELIFCEILSKMSEERRINLCNNIKYRVSNLGRCLLKARELKEWYFNCKKEELLCRSNRSISKGEVEIESPKEMYEIEFKLPVNQFRELIESTKLKKIQDSIRAWNLPDDLFFFPTSEYDNSTYYEALTDFIKKANRKLQGKYIDNETIKILITGGASRMDIVKTIIESIFPQSCTVFMNDPATNVATGLALRGRAEVLSARFVDDVKLTLFPKIDHMIKSSIDKLNSSIAKYITDAVVKEVIVKEIMTACNNKKQRKDLASSCIRKTNSWIKDGHLKSQIRMAVKKWFTSSIIEKVNDPLRILATNHSIPTITLTKKTASNMVQSINITPLVNVLTEEMEPAINSAIENNMNWLNQILDIFGLFDLGKLTPEQKEKLQEQIHDDIFKNIKDQLKNDKKLFKGLKKTLTNDIKMEIQIAISRETCTYL